MERSVFGDAELTWNLRGAGEPVVLVHASGFARWYEPMIPHLGRFSTLWYRRHLGERAQGGYRPLSIAEDAGLCLRLMDHVGWQSAHVVGHSYGGLVALQLAIDTPYRVRSLTLMEPAARGLSDPAAIAAALQPVVAAYREGDAEKAIDGFLRHVCGDGYRMPLESAIPGAFDDAVSEADLFFQAEMPAVQAWSFDADAASGIVCPVLDILGANSVQRFVDGAGVLERAMPFAERLVIADAGHLMMVQNPVSVARGLGDFILRHQVTEVTR